MTFEFYQPNIGECSGGKRLFDSEILSVRNGIVVRVPNWLGDCMMAMPAVYKLRSFLRGEAGLFVICPNKLAALWESAPWVDAVIPIKGGKRLLFTEEAKVLRKMRPGLAVVFPNSFGSALDVAFKGIPRRLGRSGRGRSVLLNRRLSEWKRPSGEETKHQLQHYLELISSVGEVGWDTEYPSLEFRDVDLGSVFFGSPVEDSGKLLVLAPGAAYGPAKQWPSEYYVEAGKMWAEKYGAVAVVGSPGEKEDAQVIVDGVGGKAVNLAGKTNLKELGAVFKASDAVLANDSGSMHYAAACGCDGVAVFGSTSSVATGPIGGRWILFESTLDCTPCFRRTCMRDERKYECLRQFSPADVFAALEVLVKEKGMRS